MAKRKIDDDVFELKNIFLMTETMVVPRKDGE